MLFNSYEFIFLFLPIMFIGYFLLLHKRLVVGAKAWLVGGSLLFYSYWNPIYLPLILASILINFSIGTSIGAKLRKDVQYVGKKSVSVKSLLFTGIIFNLGLLGYFKYTDFFLESWNGIFGTDIPLAHIALPLAISFFTFQQIAYLVDSYKGETKETDFLNYAVFVTFFPQLIAGPIVHHKEMMPQFASKWNWARNYRNIAMGVFIFSLGLFKKVVIADTFASWATNGFDHAEVLTLFEAWATSLSYTFQIYYDFSGYTDMAIGAALLFNIKLPINFNSPYKARNIQDFWRRWHITLSRFLRDYIYIPLGGNRVGQYRNYFNLFTVFLLGGLWHGASWMFVIWGALHGVAMVIHRIWNELGFRMWRWAAWFITFNFVNITWVFFRAKDMESAEKVLGGMVGLDGVALHPFMAGPLSFLKEYGIEFGHWGLFENSVVVIPLMFVVFFVTITVKNSSELLQEKISAKKAMLSMIAMGAGLTFMSRVSEFLYFNF